MRYHPLTFFRYFCCEAIMSEALKHPSLTKHRAILDRNKLEVDELSNRPDLKDDMR